MPLVRKSQGSVPHEAATPAHAGVLEGLSNASEEVRWAAARAAAGVEGCAARLSAALRVEPAARVREAMFTSLARMGDAASAAALLPLLLSDDASLRSGALDALRAMIGNVRELLPSLLHDADVDLRILSCELVRLLPAEVATPLLCNLLRYEPDPNVCAAALDVLAETGHSEALPVLAECAARFRGTPFLSFAIEVAAERLGSRAAASRA